jgi:hypothetical protein
MKYGTAQKIRRILFSSGALSLRMETVTHVHVNLHPHLQKAYTALKAKTQRKTFMAWKVKRQYNIRLLFSVTPMFSTAFLKQQNLPTDVHRGVDCSNVDWSSPDGSVF